MIDKVLVYPRLAKGSKDVIKDLIFVVLDDVGSSKYGFILSETTKDSNSHGTLKVSINGPFKTPYIHHYKIKFEFFILCCIILPNKKIKSFSS